MQRQIRQSRAGKLAKCMSPQILRPRARCRLRADASRLKAHPHVPPIPLDKEVSVRFRLAAAQGTPVRPQARHSAYLVSPQHPGGERSHPVGRALDGGLQDTGTSQGHRTLVCGSDPLPLLSQVPTRFPSPLFSSPGRRGVGFCPAFADLLPP